MLNSIIERNKILSPLSETEIKIIKCAFGLFLEKGYSASTLKNIADLTGIKQGNITYHFRAKEDLLVILMQEMMDYHVDMIEDTHNETSDPLFSYALEIATQIALCETDERARDIYYSSYTLPKTFMLIKEWTAKKNYNLLGSLLPDFSEADFRRLENVASCIELSGIVTICDRYFTLEDKVLLVLDSLMKLYGFDEKERLRIAEKIKETDYTAMATEMFEKFVSRLDNDIE